MDDVDALHVFEGTSPVRSVLPYRYLQFRERDVDAVMTGERTTFVSHRKDLGHFDMAKCVLEVETYRPTSWAELEFQTADLTGKNLRAQCDGVGVGVRRVGTIKNLEHAPKDPASRFVVDLDHGEDEPSVELVAPRTPSIPVDPLLPRPGEDIERLIPTVPDGAVEFDLVRIYLANETREGDRLWRVRFRHRSRSSIFFGEDHSDRT
jgi:hypothetical protein